MFDILISFLFLNFEIDFVVLVDCVIVIQLCLDFSIDFILF
jgi:hypothetical protein